MVYLLLVSHCLCVYVYGCVASRPVHSRWDIWGGLFIATLAHSLTQTNTHKSYCEKSNVMAYAKIYKSTLCINTQMPTQIYTHNPDTQNLSSLRVKEWISADSPFFKLWREFHRGHLKWKIGVTVPGKHIHTHTHILSISFCCSLFSQTHCVPWVLLSVPCNLTGRDLQ